MSQLTFFDDDNQWPVPPTLQNSVFIGTLPKPIWTETKAKLIAGYLKLFLFITKHGTYIDGFAGPQDSNNLDSWAAKLVLEMEPKWFRDLYLCELNRNSFRQLDEMVTSQPPVKGRTVESHLGDFNQWVHEILATPAVTDSKATFALLDQRSCECHWSTVEALANHKKSGRKVELFYFFPTGWVHRTISGFRDKAPLTMWWGDESWVSIPQMTQDAAAQLMTTRIRDLGYRDVKAWPIFENENGGGRTMYHMIHATDHDEAPRLMYRAYTKLVGSGPQPEQYDLVSQLEREQLEAFGEAQDASETSECHRPFRAASISRHRRF